MPSTRELLEDLVTLDDCEAWIATDAEHRSGKVPQPYEVVLRLERDDKQVRMNLRRHDAELIIEVLHEVLHPTAGGSIRQKLWKQLDDVMDELKAEGRNGSSRSELKGRARGLAAALAEMTNPYQSDTDAIRKEATERWRARQAHARSHRPARLG